MKHAQKNRCVTSINAMFGVAERSNDYDTTDNLSKFFQGKRTGGYAGSSFARAARTGAAEKECSGQDFRRLAGGKCAKLA